MSRRIHMMANKFVCFIPPLTPAGPIAMSERFASMHDLAACHADISPCHVVRKD